MKGSSFDRLRTSMAATLVAVLVFAQARPAHAYLEFGVMAGGRRVTLRWSQTPVRYFVSDQGVPGVTSFDLQAAVGRAFATWQAVPTASITYQFAGVTAAQPGQDDGLSTIGFQNRPELDRVLAATSLMVDGATGELVESDIFFNAAFAWSVAPNGEANRYDLESIALHEIGHMSGLGHSALGETELLANGGRRVLGSEAIMFPIAFEPGSIAGRTLRADDIAGISDLYPDGDFTQAEGSISGRVTKDGQPIFGAHVVAYDPATGAMVASFTLTALGQFSIGGLSPGVHILRVEPIDDADVDSFFDPTVNSVDVDFRVTFFDGLVVVPHGGDSGEVALKVTRK
jgi:hypothetical protein